MTNDDVRATIDQHTCNISGIQYRFRLKACAVEKYVGPVLARTLLIVECVVTDANAEEGRRLHLGLWLTNLSELRTLLQNALQAYLAHQWITDGRGDEAGQLADVARAPVYGPVAEP